MKKLMLVFLIMGGLLLASVAFAQVFEVKGKKGVWALGGTVDRYDPYDEEKDGGKIGRLYVFLPDKKDKPKKLYVTVKTKITLKSGAEATVTQLKPGTAVQVEYKKTSKGDLKCLKVVVTNAL